MVIRAFTTLLFLYGLLWKYGYISWASDNNHDREPSTAMWDNMVAPGSFLTLQLITHQKFARYLVLI